MRDVFVIFGPIAIYGATAVWAGIKYGGHSEQFFLAAGFCVMALPALWVLFAWVAS